MFFIVDQRSFLKALRDYSADPTFLTITLSVLGTIVLVLVVNIIRANLHRERNTPLNKHVKAYVTVVSIGPEFARPMKKNLNHMVEVAVLRTVTCRAETGETIQVDLPAMAWNEVTRGAAGTLTAKGREFVSFKP